MGSFATFWQQMNWQGLLTALFSALAALLCLTVHELSHGAVAYRLGDPTAKNAGRLTLNPLPHIDWLGLLLLVTAHVGWAKPVPVDPRYFQKPKQGMALTALAGPASNLLLAWLLLVLGGGAVRLLSVLPWSWPGWSFGAVYYLALFLTNAAIVSTGLGLFNLFPIPPLDGSKVLFSLLPDRLYGTILRYERYGMLLLLAAVWLGWLNKPLTFLISRVVGLLCTLSAFPYPLF